AAPIRLKPDATAANTNTFANTNTLARALTQMHVASGFSRTGRLIIISPSDVEDSPPTRSAARVRAARCRSTPRRWRRDRPRTSPLSRLAYRGWHQARLDEILRARRALRVPSRRRASGTLHPTRAHRRRGLLRGRCRDRRARRESIRAPAAAAWSRCAIARDA